jgi:hypothetical protein
MAIRYSARISLAVKVNGKEKLVRKGKDLPDGVDPAVLRALTTNGLVVALEATDTSSPAEPVATPDTLPGERDPRPLWDAYAGVVGVDPSQYSKKPELVAAVTQAHEAKAAAEGAAGDGSGSGD